MWPLDTLLHQKGKTSFSMLDESFHSVQLPEKGRPPLTNVCTTDYSINTPAGQEACRRRCEDALNALVQTADRFTVGSVLDPCVDAQMEMEKNRFHEEMSMHDWQAPRIANTRKVRKAEIDRQLPQMEGRISQLNDEITPMKDKHAHFSLRLGNRHISLGLVATPTAMLVDAVINFSFLQNILLESQWLLILTVIALSAMSDMTMLVLGMLYSRKGENFLGKRTYYTFLGVLLGFFLVSVVASVMVKFGSMDVTFGTINAAGEWVGKSTYTLAEYGSTLPTAFITSATGILCLVLSMDRDAPQEGRRLRLEAERDALVKQYDELQAERLALELAVDPMIRDQQCREVALENLETMRLVLKLYARQLLALKINDPDYTDQMFQSAQVLLDSDAGDEDTTDAPATHEPDLKEVV